MHHPPAIKHNEMTEIEIFPWDDNFATGIAAIDAQHKQLLTLLNSLVSHLAYRAEPPALNSVFQQLKDYTLIHFRDEEAIWNAELGDDRWAVEHQHSHHSFVEEVLRLKAEESVKSLDEVITDIAAFLTHWLALHIIDSDKRLAKAVLARRRGLSLSEAKALANEEMAGASRTMINTIMSMYDKLANRTIQLTMEMNRRRAAEEELQAANAALEKARKEAVAANEAKSIYLANMSHEIRTPINAISGMLLMLQREGLTPRQAERLQRIDDASQHLLRVINDILDLSKIEAGKLSLEYLPLDPSALLHEVLAMEIPQAQAKGLRLTLAASPLPPSLIGDPTRLKQALLNYLSNAIKFTEAGEINLAAEVLDENDNGVLLRFSVRDNGPGLDEDALSRLFSNFEQADATTTRKHGGTGLGLAITGKLARLMGGEVGVNSRIGSGSTFWFTARLQRGPSGMQDFANGLLGQSEQQLAREFTGTRLLLVEDDEITREVACDLLCGAGLVVDFAEDGLIALDMAARQTYPLILMDMQMPNMGGLEATAHLRRMPSYGSTPIIAMTANAFDEDRNQCLAAGMNDFISKPIDPEKLFSIILQWLRGGTHKGSTD